MIDVTAIKAVRVERSEGCAFSIYFDDFSFFRFRNVLAISLEGIVIFRKWKMYSLSYLERFNNVVNIGT